jgi:hypothetical protein
MKLPQKMCAALPFRRTDRVRARACRANAGTALQQFFQLLKGKATALRRLFPQEKGTSDGAGNATRTGKLP